MLKEKNKVGRFTPPELNRCIVIQLRQSSVAGKRDKQVLGEDRNRPT
jgi:hypothetical protein